MAGTITNVRTAGTFISTLHALCGLLLFSFSWIILHEQSVHSPVIRDPSKLLKSCISHSEKDDQNLQNSSEIAMK